MGSWRATGNVSIGTLTAEVSSLAHGAEPSGLSTAEATRRLARYGANELTAARPTGLARQLARVLVSPLMLILLAASALAASVGEHTDAAIIALTVLLGAALDAFQTSRSSAAVERLRSSVAPTATAYRDAQWAEIPRRNLVPGDAIRLSAGDVVPADALLIAGRDLHVQQAALTGESLPAERRGGARVRCIRPVHRRGIRAGYGDEDGARL